VITASNQAVTLPPSTMQYGASMTLLGEATRVRSATSATLVACGLWQCARGSAVLVTVRGPNYKPMSVNWYITASEKVRAKWLLTGV
jgi:hypothetical protein